MPLHDLDVIDQNLKTSEGVAAFNVLADSFNSIRSRVHVGFEVIEHARFNTQLTLDIFLRKPGNPFLHPVGAVAPDGGWGRNLDEAVVSMHETLKSACRGGFNIHAQGAEFTYNAQQDRYLPVKMPGPQQLTQQSTRSR